MMTTATAQKCVHKGCGKVFTDPEEECEYHPGPPEFHEGQKGWKCCKPRVLTFDEFLAIPPCTKGKHSTVDDTPAPKPVEAETPPEPAPTPTSMASPGPATKPISTASLAAKLQQRATPSSTPQPQLPEEESDDPDAEIPQQSVCKRRGCAKSRDEKVPRHEEECVYHPGVPLFHEGSKGWTCCKRRVLEFDEFMKIEGCKRRNRHCYVGKKKPKAAEGVNGDGTETGAAAEEVVEHVRNDFYQTPASVIVSFYLKKIVQERAKVVFEEDGRTIQLDLPTSDGKRFTRTISLFASIEPAKSHFKILGTKLEMVLVKADGTSWPVLRSDDAPTGERIQVGKAGRA